MIFSYKRYARVRLLLYHRPMSGATLTALPEY
jgi:hypothetical protein